MMLKYFVILGSFLLERPFLFPDVQNVVLRTDAGMQAFEFISCGLICAIYHIVNCNV